MRNLGVAASQEMHILFAVRYETMGDQSTENEASNAPSVITCSRYALYWERFLHFGLHISPKD